ncbi:MAG TPA: acetate--CoA ligase family protein [Acidimicrobiales bacterium]|nr:acetate--CoA ligase family protein [Acidimicrobiales bacterium]
MSGRDPDDPDAPRATGARAERDALRAMLEARSVALVGASGRPGSFGERLVTETAKSRAPVELHLVNPRYDEVLGRRCVASLDELAEPVDLVLLGVPDAALEAELRRAARRGDRAAVVFGSAYEDALPGRPALRERLATLARAAGMALCGAGCMGFVNVAHGLRAIGYVEPDALPGGPIALITHSGSVFSAMLRTRRRLGFTLAVSSGQELVTTAASYLDYALDLPETRLVALVLETMREPEALRRVLGRAAGGGVRVVALTVGASATGRSMVAAHSGALAGEDGAWEALFDAYGVTRVGDLEELADTLELFSGGRRAGATSPTGGIATVHDSGAERALVADVAERVGLRFAEISPTTRHRLAGLVDAGLEPGNPLDVWGTGADTAGLVASCLEALADDADVAALALSVDLLAELDGDDSYPRAALRAHRSTAKPFAVVTNMASALDPGAADELRQQGVPVLEGTRSGLLALRHLLDEREARHLPPARAAAPHDPARRARWLARLASGPLDGAASLGLLAEYGIATVAALPARTPGEAVAAAEALGFPIVLKTDEPGIAHKSDVGGVMLGLADAGAVATAYEDLAARLGPRALVSPTAPAGVEIALGLVRDAHLGPLVVVGAGGVLVELLGDRAVGLPPIDEPRARRMLGRLRVAPLLDGMRGAAPADRPALAGAIVALSALAEELGDVLDALDVNPLLCSRAGAIAVDALVVGRGPR